MRKFIIEMLFVYSRMQNTLTGWEFESIYDR